VSAPGFSQAGSGIAATMALSGLSFLRYERIEACGLRLEQSTLYSLREILRL